MSKQKKKDRNRPLIELTKNLNKKGRLKGKNKRQTKDLKNSCLHHYLSKRGHAKSAIIDGSKGYCTCKMCGKRVRLKFYSDDSVKEALHTLIDINNQAKYMAVAINSGPETAEYFATVGVILGRYYPIHKRVVKMCKKEKHLKNKNKSKNRGTSAEYGSWGKVR